MKPTELISASRRLLTAIMLVTPGFSQLLLLAAALVALAAFFVHDARPAVAQDGEPPPVENLRCIAETGRVAFLWAAPDWHGGEVSSYDYDLTLPDGRREDVRLKGSTVVYRPGSYQPGREARLGVTVNYEASGGGTVTSAETVLACSVGGGPPTATPTPTPIPTPTATPTPTPTPSQDSGSNHAALIAQMYQWRNDPCCVSNKAHTDRWDRALLVFGETVADTTLTAMTSSEAQGYADRGWNRWVEVAKALKELETASADAELQQLQMQTPAPGDTVWSATLTAFNEGIFVGCDDAYGQGCELNLSENSFTYKGKTYVVTGLYLHRGRFGPYDRSITMKFWRTDVSPPTDLYLSPNLHDLALRIEDDALFSIVDGMLYSKDYTVWKNPGHKLDHR